MQSLRTSIAALLGVLAFAACSDNTGPGPQADKPQAEKPSAAVTRTGISKAVAGTCTSGTFAGQTFTGTLSITRFTTNSAGQLLANGVLTGTTSGGQTINQVVSNIPVVFDPQRCTILHLEVGPIFLNLLGLQLTTNEIVIDLTAVAGPGNLLGNLLCAIAHLLDQTPRNTAALAALLRQINAILAGL